MRVTYNLVFPLETCTGVIYTSFYKKLVFEGGSYTKLLYSLIKSYGGTSQIIFFPESRMGVHQSLVFPHKLLLGVVSSGAKPQSVFIIVRVIVMGVPPDNINVIGTNIGQRYYGGSNP